MRGGVRRSDDAHASVIDPLTIPHWRCHGKPKGDCSCVYRHPDLRETTKGLAVDAFRVKLHSKVNYGSSFEDLISVSIVSYVWARYGLHSLTSDKIGHVLAHCVDDAAFEAVCSLATAGAIAAPQRCTPAGRVRSFIEVVRDLDLEHRLYTAIFVFLAGQDATHTAGVPGLVRPRR